MNDFPEVNVMLYDTLFTSCFTDDFLGGLKKWHLLFEFHIEIEQIGKMRLC